MVVTKKKKLGFASMDTEKQRKIASLGGRTAHKMGVAHKFTSEEARAASLKGWAKRFKKMGIKTGGGK